jgi:NAD(P)-dependent dehydrogenase (short-subunit alcohol dehydrogenase family)
MEVRGSVALVTGAAAGAGRAIARRLGADGALVVVADVDLRAGQETAQSIEAQGSSARFVQTDVTSSDDVRRMIAFAERELGRPQILINNAGGGGHVEPHFPDADPDRWQAILDLNLGSAMLATQLALGPMRLAGGGVIVNIASTAGLGFGPYVSPEYGAAKAGLIRFTSSLAGLRERMNVRINCVVPDWIATERAREELARMMPAQRAATPAPIPPEEIADAVVEFAGDEDLAGRIMVMWPGEPARLLDPALRLWRSCFDGTGHTRPRFRSHFAAI